MEGHAKDQEIFANVARNRRRRAKACLDFERHDDDELGFRKNDIITVSYLLLCLHLISIVFQNLIRFHVLDFNILLYILVYSNLFLLKL